MALSIDLKDKTVLVTGVTSGIGAGVAKQFALAGVMLQDAEGTLLKVLKPHRLLHQLSLLERKLCI